MLMRGNSGYCFGMPIKVTYVFGTYMGTKKQNFIILLYFQLAENFLLAFYFRVGNIYINGDRENMWSCHGWAFFASDEHYASVQLGLEPRILPMQL